MISVARLPLYLVVVSLLAACSGTTAGNAVDAIGGAPPGTAAADAAKSLAAILPDSTRSVALRTFADADRTRWFFIPTEIVAQGRAGLPLKRMTPAQREAAFSMLGTALSADGFRTARAIIANETQLGALEDAAGVRRYARDPEQYFVTLFGTSAGAEPWGWRFEGHHLSVNVTGADEKRPVVAPLFMGANPHRVPSGPRAGTRMLAAEEDAARALLALFVGPQRARVIVADSTYGDIRSRNDPKAPVLVEEGVAASEMSPAQQAALRVLLGIYAARMEPASARAQLQRIEAAGFGRLRFVWAGSTEVGKAHYYRVQGPTVLVEYDNTQNNANHSHTVWRDLENDFGGDLLRAHYERHPH